MAIDLESFLVTDAAAMATDALSGRLLKQGDIIGGHEVLAFLGGGSSAEVWKVRKDGTLLALKIFNPDQKRPEIARERFLTEAAMLQKMTIPHLVRAISAGEHNGQPYFTMQLLRPLPEAPGTPFTATILLDVCEALKGLHDLGIIHRDIKPDNVLLDGENRAFLVDLGIAHIDNDELAEELQRSEAHNLTVCGGGFAVGTPAFAAPEQLRGLDVSPASDIHAIGVMTNRLLGDSQSTQWKNFIRRATSSVPELRYPGIDEVRKAIKSIQHRPLRMALAIALCATLTTAMTIMALFRNEAPPNQPASVNAFGIIIGSKCGNELKESKPNELTMIPFKPFEGFAFFSDFKKIVDGGTRQCIGVGATDLTRTTAQKDAKSLFHDFNLAMNAFCNRYGCTYREVSTDKDKGKPRKHYQSRFTRGDRDYQIDCYFTLYGTTNGASVKRSLTITDKTAEQAFARRINK